jgi:hypothetical protein
LYNVAGEKMNTSLKGNIGDVHSPLQGLQKVAKMRTKKEVTEESRHFRLNICYKNCNVLLCHYFSSLYFAQVFTTFDGCGSDDGMHD